MNGVDKIIVRNTATIKEAMRVIDKGAVKVAIVVDENKRLRGIITDGDIRRGILEGVTIEEPVIKIMNASPIFYEQSNFPREEVMDIIKNGKIIGVPLVDENKVVKEFIMVTEGTDLYYFNEKIHSKKHLRRILVVGGAGYIGSILTRKLLSRGYGVNVLDMLLYGEESLKEIINNPHLRLIQGDTRHLEDITESIHGVDAVVHLAELVGDPACALNPRTTQEINYFATKTVASICKHFQINRLVYASSCSVYGASKGDELLTEESFLNPVSLYAKMKIASEKALIEIKDSNFMPTILRLGTVFGFSPRPRFDLVVNVLTARALKEGRITIMGGHQWRPHVYIEDVVDTIVAVLEAPLEKVGGEIFNVGIEENNYTLNQLGELVREAVPAARLIVDGQEKDQRDYKVSFAKLRNILDVEFKGSVRHGIGQIKEALEQNPDMDYTDRKYSNIKFLEEKVNKPVEALVARG